MISDIDTSYLNYLKSRDSQFMHKHNQTHFNFTKKLFHFKQLQLKILLLIQISKLKKKEDDVNPRKGTKKKSKKRKTKWDHIHNITHRSSFSLFAVRIPSHNN